MLDQCPDSNGAPKPDGMVERGNAVLVGSVNVRAGL
jgi:hypothetical protein